MDENYAALFVAIVSKQFYTSEQAFRALEHGGWNNERTTGNKTGCLRMEIDYERVLKLKERMSWEEIGAALGIKPRTLSRRVLAYVHENQADMPTKKGGRRPLKIDIEKALEMKEGMTWEKVAETMGISNHTLKAHAYKYMRDNNIKVEKKTGRKLLDIPMEKALEMKEGMTWAEVGQTLGFNAKTLKKRCYNLNKLKESAV